MGLPYHPDFHPGLAYLCTTPLRFRSQPPQLNCPPDNVPSPNLYWAKVSLLILKEWSFINAQALPPIAKQLKINQQYQVAVKLHGVFLSRQD